MCFFYSEKLKFSWCGPEAFVCVSSSGKMHIVPISGGMKECREGQLVDIVTEIDGVRIITETKQDW